MTNIDLLASNVPLTIKDFLVENTRDLTSKDEHDAFTAEFDALVIKQRNTFQEIANDSSLTPKQEKAQMSEFIEHMRLQGETVDEHSENLNPNSIDRFKNLEKQTKGFLVLQKTYFLKEKCKDLLLNIKNKGIDYSAGDLYDKADELETAYDLNNSQNTLSDEENTETSQVILELRELANNKNLGEGLNWKQSASLKVTPEESKQLKSNCLTAYQNSIDQMEISVAKTAVKDPKAQDIAGKLLDRIFDVIEAYDSAVNEDQSKSPQHIVVIRSCSKLISNEKELPGEIKESLSNDITDFVLDSNAWTQEETTEKAISLITDISDTLKLSSNLDKDHPIFQKLETAKQHLQSPLPFKDELSSSFAQAKQLGTDKKTIAGSVGTFSPTI
jgi:hypothetical protein